MTMAVGTHELAGDAGNMPATPQRIWTGRLFSNVNMYFFLLSFLGGFLQG